MWSGMEGMIWHGGRGQAWQLQLAIALGISFQNSALGYFTSKQCCRFKARSDRHRMPTVDKNCTAMPTDRLHCYPCSIELID